MTDKEFVIHCYPNASVYHLPPPKFAVRSGGYLIYTGEQERKGWILENLCLSGLVSTEELAWSVGAEQIRKDMVAKLES